MCPACIGTTGRLEDRWKTWWRLGVDDAWLSSEMLNRYEYAVGELEVGG